MDTWVVFISCIYVKGDIWFSLKVPSFFCHPHIQKPNKPNSGVILSEVVDVQSLGHCRTPPYGKLYRSFAFQFFLPMKRGGNRKTKMKIERSIKRLNPKKMKREGNGVQWPHWICCRDPKMNIIKPSREVLYKLGEGLPTFKKKVLKKSAKNGIEFCSCQNGCAQKTFFTLADFIGILKNHALQQEEFHHLSSKRMSSLNSSPNEIAKLISSPK